MEHYCSYSELLFFKGGPLVQTMFYECFFFFYTVHPEACTTELHLEEV